MATPKSILWPRDPHTAAKHQLLRHYLAAWAPIILTTFDTATYLEGFAGPGIYEGGEPGSPILAYEEIATALRYGAGWSARMGLIERSPERIAELQHQIEAMPRPYSEITVRYRQGACADQAVDLLGSMNALGKPIFAFLDSFSGADVPFDLVAQIAANKGSEVLITFGSSFFTRFGSVEIHAGKGDIVFGGPEWRQVLTLPREAKIRYLVDHYRHATLPAAGFTHNLAFEMRDEGGHSLWLIFGTNHARGLEKMKEAMWKVDPYHGLRYVDAADPMQIAMDIAPEPDTSALEREITELVGKAEGNVAISSLKQFALLETIYKPTQVIPVVRRLIAKGKVSRVDKGTLKNESMVSRPVAPMTPEPEQLAAF